LRYHCRRNDDGTSCNPQTGEIISGGFAPAPESCARSINDRTASNEWLVRRFRSLAIFAFGLVVKSSGMAAYEDWRKMPAGAWLIDCSFMNRKKPRVAGVYRVWEGGIVKLSESHIQFAYKTRSVLVGLPIFQAVGR
jgi:hypothetical protein